MMRGNKYKHTHTINWHANRLSSEIFEGVCIAWLWKALPSDLGNLRPSQASLPMLYACICCSNHFRPLPPCLHELTCTHTTESMMIIQHDVYHDPRHVVMRLFVDGVISDDYCHQHVIPADYCHENVSILCFAHLCNVTESQIGLGVPIPSRLEVRSPFGQALAECEYDADIVSCQMACSRRLQA